MESAHIENFKDLMKTAKNISDKSKNILPVFHKARGKLHDLSSKTLKSMDATAKVKISSLQNSIWTRTSPNPTDIDAHKKSDAALPFVINWVVQVLKEMLHTLDEQGDIMRVHSEALADPKIVIDSASNREVVALKEENVKLREEIDETRQRGMKGNILVSSPASATKPTMMIPKALDTSDNRKVNESEVEMVLRVIREKTSIVIPEEDIIACHRVGKKETNSFVVRFNNRKPGSAWEVLTAAMMKPKGLAKDKNVFLNFQLTKHRADLAKAVRQAKKDEKIAAYSIDRNGTIKIKKLAGDKEYLTVKSVNNLDSMLQ